MSSDDNATRRSEGRERRRAATRAGDHHADGDDGSGRGGLETAARAAATAAALGAALGAVKALAGHDGDEAEQDSATATDEPADDHDEPADEYDEPADESSAPSAEHAREEQQSDDDATQRVQQPAGRRREAAPSSPREGASTATVRSIAASAREQLRELQGREVESITALERTNDGWCVTCEVVEVERIPNSTDVLATYVIELDGDGELIAFERVRRYYRAQADRRGER